MVINKGEDCRASGVVREGLFGLLRGNGCKAGQARAQSCFISQVINLDLQKGCLVVIGEQLEVNWEAGGLTDRGEKVIHKEQRQEENKEKSRWSGNKDTVSTFLILNTHIHTLGTGASSAGPRHHARHHCPPWCLFVQPSSSPPGAQRVNVYSGLGLQSSCLEPPGF